MTDVNDELVADLQGSGMRTLGEDDREEDARRSGRVFRRIPSSASISIGSGERVQGGVSLMVSKVNALRRSVEDHSKVLTQLLLTSKDSRGRRDQISSAFRSCKDAFMELTGIVSQLIGSDNRTTEALTVDDIRKVLRETLREESERTERLRVARSETGGLGERARTYASVAGSVSERVQMGRGTNVEVPVATSFLIVPEGKNVKKYNSSQATKDEVSKIFKPAECGLRIDNVYLARGNGIRIEASNPDMARVRASTTLAKADFKVVENPKTEPRIIVHGVPSEMASEEIREELVAQNVDEGCADQLRVVYVFPVRDKRRTKSCIIEVSPAVRKQLMEKARIYLRFSSCPFSDYIRVLQCFRCLAFGHLAANCKGTAACGHCASQHETRDCTNREDTPACWNCQNSRVPVEGGHAHSALDTVKCPILVRRMKDRISNINYG